MKNKLLLITFIIFNVLRAEAIDLQKIEPSNWWTGMKNTKLQILLYGNEISDCNVKLKNSTAKLIDINKTDNPDYLFLNIDLKGVTASSIQIELQKGKEVKTISYQLKKKELHQKEISSKDVVYLLMPDRFSNGNKNNDSIGGMLDKTDRNKPDSRHGGDIQGIINNLDYFRNMGFSALWLTPVQENNQPKYSYHGYSITDFYNVDKRFGSNNDYKKLADLAHEKDIKIIMDMVYNHAGLYHWWFKDLPSKDWVNNPFKNGIDLEKNLCKQLTTNMKWDNFRKTNYNTSTLSDPYASKKDRDDFSQGWFDTGMADLNQKNPLLSQYLKQMTLWWIETIGIDGLRIDTYPYSDKTFIAELVQRIYDEYPGFYIVGEVWTEDVVKERYWTKEKMQISDYNSPLESLTSFRIVNAINDAFKENGNIYELYKTLSQDFMFTNPSNSLIFADNHDVQRFAKSVNEDIAAYKLGYTFLFTTRGIPQVYQGSEIFCNGDMHKSHGVGRRDMPGGWLDDSSSIFIRKNLPQKESDMLNFFSKILNWRKNNCELIAKGKLTHFIPQNQVYTYFRYNENKKVMVILNNNTKSQKLDYNYYKECIGNSQTGTDVITGKEFNLTYLNIEPKTSLILELK